MADQKAPQMQATLGLTGLTSNAMALIAPGAFLWLTFFIRPPPATTAPAMWLGIFAALLLCLATAVAYAEISKLYPGTGSSYYYAEQALLSKDKAFKYARVAKFIVGWGSHLYYWVYPGVMVAATGIFVRLCRRLPLSQLHERLQSRAGLHGAGGGCLLVLRRLDRIQGRGRIDRRQPRHQRHSDLRAGGLQRAGPRLSRQPSRGHAGLPVRWPDAGHLHLSVRHGQGRLDDARLRAAAPLPLLDSAGKPVPFTIDLSDDGLKRQLPHSPQRRVGDCAAQVQLTCSSRPRSPF